MKNKLLIIAYIILALGLVFWPVALSFGDIYTASRATVRIRSGEGVGTGIIVGSNAEAYYALTNAHVADRATLGVEFFEGGEVVRNVPTAVTISRDVKNDVAVVKIPKAALGDYVPRIVPIDAAYTPKTGEVLATIGHPYGSPPTAFFCTYKGTNGVGIVFVPGPAQGRSGSALFTEDFSRVIGLIYAQSVEPKGYGFAVPAPNFSKATGQAMTPTAAESLFKGADFSKVQRFTATIEGPREERPEPYPVPYPDTPAPSPEPQAPAATRRELLDFYPTQYYYGDCPGGTCPAPQTVNPNTRLFGERHNRGDYGAFGLSPRKNQDGGDMAPSETIPLLEFEPAEPEKIIPVLPAAPDVPSAAEEMTLEELKEVRVGIVGLRKQVEANAAAIAANAKATQQILTFLQENLTMPTAPVTVAEPETQTTRRKLGDGLINRATDKGKEAAAEVTAEVQGKVADTVSDIEQKAGGLIDQAKSAAAEVIDPLTAKADSYVEKLTAFGGSLADRLETAFYWLLGAVVGIVALWKLPIVQALWGAIKTIYAAWQGRKAENGE